MKSWPKPDYTEIPLHRRRRLKELVYKVTKLGRIFMHSPPLPNILPPGFDPCLIMSDKENEKELRDIMRQLNSINNKQKLEDDNLNINEDQNTEWQILDAFKIRFMNTRIFWIVTVHVVVGLYIWLMS